MTPERLAKLRKWRENGDLEGAVEPELLEYVDQLRAELATVQTAYANACAVYDERDAAIARAEAAEVRCSELEETTRAALKRAGIAEMEAVNAKRACVEMEDRLMRLEARALAAEKRLDGAMYDNAAKMFAHLKARAEAAEKRAEQADRNLALQEQRTRDYGDRARAAESLAEHWEGRSRFLEALLREARQKLADAGVEGSPPPGQETTIGLWMGRAHSAEALLREAKELADVVYAMTFDGGGDIENLPRFCQELLAKLAAREGT